jgi:hypothetical protein
MTKTIKELVQAAEAAVAWMEDATCPNEVNSVARALRTAIQNVKDSDKTGIRTGYLLLVELPSGLRRVTITVAPPDQYIKRAGWSHLGTGAEVTYSEEVNDLTWARDDLKTILPDEKWSGAGMEWSDLPKDDLLAAMKTVAESVNNHFRN